MYCSQCLNQLQTTTLKSEDVEIVTCKICGYIISEKKVVKKD